MVGITRTTKRGQALRPVRCSLMKVKSGKCHRYMPYEIRPRNVNGRNESSRATGENWAQDTLSRTAEAARAAMENPPR